MKSPSIKYSEWSISVQNFISRWTTLEYLPIYVINIPVFLFYVLFAVRARHPLFFTATNPELHTGGLFGLDKNAILSQFPVQFLPKTLEASEAWEVDNLLRNVQEAKLQLPIIAKPNVGERGYLVDKITSWEALSHYHQTIYIPYLIQEYVDYQQEYSVLYTRFPGEKKGQITSLCRKLPLSVTGDGHSTLKELILSKERSRLQWKRLKQIYKDSLQTIPENGQTITLEIIGNHSRGATFLDANREIDPALESAFDQLMVGQRNLHFVRFDLKCKDLASLRGLKHFKIVEINGVGGEPAHVYDPDNTPLSFYKDMYAHWRRIYQIGRRNHSLGVKYMPFLQGVNAFYRYVSQKQNAIT